jgi:hypothetical protein
MLSLLRLFVPFAVPDDATRPADINFSLVADSFPHLIAASRDLRTLHGTAMKLCTQPAYARGAGRWLAGFPHDTTPDFNTGYTWQLLVALVAGRAQAAAAEAEDDHEDGHSSDDSGSDIQEVADGWAGGNAGHAFTRSTHRAAPDGDEEDGDDDDEEEEEEEEAEEEEEEANVEAEAEEEAGGEEEAAGQGDAEGLHASQAGDDDDDDDASMTEAVAGGGASQVALGEVDDGSGLSASGSSEASGGAGGDEQSGDADEEERASSQPVPGLARGTTVLASVTGADPVASRARAARADAGLGEGGSGKGHAPGYAPRATGTGSHPATARPGRR